MKKQTHHFDKGGEGVWGEVVGECESAIEML